MIKLISSMPDYNKADLSFAKICCNFSAYGCFDKIALFWAQTDVSGKTTSVISLMNSSMIISENNSDIPELDEFVKVINPISIFCDTSVAEKLGLKTTDTFVSLKVLEPNSKGNACENLLIGVNTLYDKMSGEFDLGERDYFIADITHRIRHNSAFYVSGSNAYAICFISDSYAVITGITTAEPKRMTGLGSAVLQRLLQSTGNREVYACASQEIVPFYIKNNFAAMGSVSHCIIIGDQNE